MRAAVEILLVEANPEDAELTLRALKQRNLANQLNRPAGSSDGSTAPARAGGGRPRGEFFVVTRIRPEKIDKISTISRVCAHFSV
jgi:hypothetical protein